VAGWVAEVLCPGRMVEWLRFCAPAGWLSGWGSVPRQDGWVAGWVAEVLCPGRMVEWLRFCAPAGWLSGWGSVPRQDGWVGVVPWWSSTSSGSDETYAVRHARPQTGLPQIISIQLPLPLPPPPLPLPPPPLPLTFFLAFVLLIHLGHF
jgi:hypothetical protein